jgi:hypothetical protein
VVRARTVVKILLGVVVTVLLGGGGLVAFTFYRVYRSAGAFDVSVARTQKLIATHEQRFLEDQAYLAGLPLFAPRKGTRDAGPVIGPRIHWVRMKPGVVDYPALSGDAIDRGLYDKLGEDWLNALPERWIGLDFGWMGLLAQLDYWDLEQNSVGDPTDLHGPEPLSEDLLAWAELRLAKGLSEKALAPALAEVQDLARLCFTAERFNSNFDGIRLLATVKLAQKRAGGPLPNVDLGRIQRGFFGALPFARLETPPEYAATFDRIAVGRCAALHEGAWTAIAVRPGLFDSRVEEFNRLEQLFTRTPQCRLGRMRERWALPDDVTPTYYASSWWDRILWQWSPAWRRIQGEFLVAIGAQEWFKGYDRESSVK